VFLYRFKKLLEEEHALSNDLKNLENKYKDWCQTVSPSLLKPPVKSGLKSYISNTDSSREVSYKPFTFKCLGFIIIIVADIITITIILLLICSILGTLYLLRVLLPNITI